MKYLPAVGQINPRIKIAQKFMFDMSSTLILTATFDKSFIEHLPQVIPKLVREFDFQFRL